MNIGIYGILSHRIIEKMKQDNLYISADCGLWAVLSAARPRVHTVGGSLLEDV